MFLTSEGEAIVYSGTDPASDATWALVGVFQIGRPIGRRCMTKVGPDIVVITEDGFVPLSGILPVDQSQADAVAISHQINSAVHAAVIAGSTLFGWQPILYTKGRMLIFNVPTTATVFEQYVFNTITGAACKFTNMNAFCWGVMGDRIFFGRKGKTVEFNNEADGILGDNSVDIPSDAITAFQYFGNRGQKQSFKRVEIVLDRIANPNADPPTLGKTAVSLDFWTDYQVDTPVGTAVTITPTVGTIARAWRGVRGIGRSAAVEIRLDSLVTATPKWLETVYIYVPGSII